MWNACPKGLLRSRVGVQDFLSREAVRDRMRSHGGLDHGLHQRCPKAGADRNAGHALDSFERDPRELGKQRRRLGGMGVRIRSGLG
jgi:hypothetical protein